MLLMLHVHMMSNYIAWECWTLGKKTFMPGVPRLPREAEFLFGLLATLITATFVVVHSRLLFVVSPYPSDVSSSFLFRFA